MHSKIKITAILGATVAFIICCSVTLQMPTNADAEKYGTSLDTLVAGRSMYIEHCNSCHSLFLPKKFTAGEWDMYMLKMKKKAKISDAQAGVILKYVKAGCKPE